MTQLHNSAVACIRSYLAIYEKLEQRNGLLCTILVHARHVKVIKEDHELLPHGRPIRILRALLCPILYS